MKNTLLIGGSSLSPGKAADWLVCSYPAATLDWYDLAGSSRRDGVTLEDLGRMTVFAARLDYKGAVSLLEKGQYAPWSSMKRTANLDAHADSTEVDFVRDAQTRAAVALFQCFAPGFTRWAWTSKLLHMKWPSFYPIADSAFRVVYGRDARAIHRDVLPGAGYRTPRTRAPINAYWLAFRRDLIANGAAMESLKSGLPAAARRAERAEPRAADKAAALAKVTPLRLLDMLVWGIGSKRLTSD